MAPFKRPGPNLVGLKTYEELRHANAHIAYEAKPDIVTEAVAGVIIIVPYCVVVAVYALWLQRRCVSRPLLSKDADFENGTVRRKK